MFALDGFSSIGISVAEGLIVQFGIRFLLHLSAVIHVYITALVFDCRSSQLTSNNPEEIANCLQFVRQFSSRGEEGILYIFDPTNDTRKQMSCA